MRKECRFGPTPEFPLRFRLHFFCFPLRSPRLFFPRRSRVSTGKILLPALFQSGSFFPGELGMFEKTTVNKGFYPVALTLLSKPS